MRILFSRYLACRLSSFWRCRRHRRWRMSRTRRISSRHLPASSSIIRAHPSSSPADHIDAGMASARRSTFGSRSVGQCDGSRRADTAAATGGRPKLGISREWSPQQASANGVPASLVHRVIMRESRYNPRAVSRGNYGMMQIRLGTARAMGYSGSAAGLLDAETNMTYAVRYLAGAYRAAGGDENRAVALYARGYYPQAKAQGFSPYAEEAAANTQPENNFAGKYRANDQSPGPRHSAISPAPMAKDTTGIIRHNSARSSVVAGLSRTRPRRIASRAQLFRATYFQPLRFAATLPSWRGATADRRNHGLLANERICRVPIRTGDIARGQVSRHVAARGARSHRSARHGVRYRVHSARHQDAVRRRIAAAPRARHRRRRGFGFVVLFAVRGASPRRAAAVICPHGRQCSARRDGRRRAVGRRCFRRILPRQPAQCRAVAQSISPARSEAGPTPYVTSDPAASIPSLLLRAGAVDVL